MHLGFVDGAGVGEGGVEVGASCGGIGCFFGGRSIFERLVLSERCVGFEHQILLFGFYEIHNNF